MLVSIVISTYNRYQFLEKLLLSLKYQTYDNFEVIVVNGPSTDETPELLKRYEDQIIISNISSKNLSKSRNKGIKLANGEIILFIDDDGVPYPNWIESILSKYDNEKIGGVGGYILDNTGVNFQCKEVFCDRFGNVIPFDKALYLNSYNSIFFSLTGCNSSFRKAALEEINYFDENIEYYLDETDVCLRIIDRGYRLTYSPLAVVHHAYAPSHLRTKENIPKTLYVQSKSKSYFIYKHNYKFGEDECIHEILKFKNQNLKYLDYHKQNQSISEIEYDTLKSEMMSGLLEGKSIFYNDKKNFS